MDSRKDARAASAGAILVTRLMQRDCAGVITDGGFRDSAEIADLGFPGVPPPSQRADQFDAASAIEINVPIGCGDAPVFPGDVILATPTVSSSSPHTSQTRSQTKPSR